MAAKPDNAEEVRQLVDRAVRAAVPADAMVERGVRPDSEYTWPQPTPVGGFLAAQHVRKLAEARMYGYVAGLRGEGRPWREIADLLEIPWSSEYSRVERAFELTADAVGHDSTWSGPRIYWYCGGPLGCGQHVTDLGPYNGSPSDNESGHADGCSRVARETTDYERACDEAEERARVMDEAYAQLPEHSFAKDTANRARHVVAHGGQYLGWSTGETLAVALVLNDIDELNRRGYSTRRAAVDRVIGNMADPPPNAAAWLALVRAAATGTSTDA